MNLPGRPIQFDKAKLEEFLSPRVIWDLRRELDDPRWGVKLQDESTLRYIFTSVLEWHGVPCPHPWRIPIPGTSMAGAFECKMCRCWFIPTV